MAQAIIYVRLSSYQGKADTTTSPERQEEVCRAYCAAHGWDVVDVIHDLDVSGSDKGLRLDRPGLLRVRARWDAADVLVFAKIDRIARNVADWERIREEADSHGVALVSVGESLDLSTPSGRFVATILQAFAAMEAAMVSTRTREAVAFMAREGRHRGGLAAFGWRAAQRDDGPGYVLRLDPDKAPILREVVNRTIAGEPSDRIVEEFNSKGVPSAEGKGWETTSLRKLLRRPILRGMQVHRGEIVRGPDGLPIRPHEPLLTDEEWRQLQTALDSRVHKGGWWRKPPHLLKGIAVCDLCGRTLHNIDQEGKSGTLKCSRHSRSGQRCPGVAIHRERLEAYVEETFLTMFGDVQITEEETVESMSGEALGIEEALDYVTAQLRDVDDEEEEAALLVQRRQLRKRKKELEALPIEPTVRVIEVGETYVERWNRSDLDTRRALLASMIDTVRVRKGRRGGHGMPTRDRVDIRWKGMS